MRMAKRRQIEKRKVHRTGEKGDERKCRGHEENQAGSLFKSELSRRSEVKERKNQQPKKGRRTPSYTCVAACLHVKAERGKGSIGLALPSSSHDCRW